MTTTDLTPWLDRYRDAVTAGDDDAVDSLYEQMPAELHERFGALLATELPLPELQRTVDEARDAYIAAGFDIERAQLSAMLSHGRLGELIAAHVATCEGGVDALVDELLEDLSIAQVDGARPRLRAVVCEAIAGTGNRERRIAPAALDAFARVLDVPRALIDELRMRSPMEGTAFAAAAARSTGENGQLVNADAIDADDDALDALFNGSAW
jgi:hypothetical protein